MRVVWVAVVPFRQCTDRQRRAGTGVLRGGAAGLMTAVLIGTICAALMLGLRFHLVSKRVIGRL